MTATQLHHDSHASSSKPLKLWLISADTRGHDVYKSAVVAAESEEEARRTHPRRNIGIRWCDIQHEWIDPHDKDNADYSWAGHPDLVTAREIGIAAPGVEAGVITAAFLNG